MTEADDIAAGDVAKDLAFDVSEFHARLARVRVAMEGEGLSCLVAMGPEDIYFLTGFRSLGYFEWQALLVTLAEEPIMISRALEERMYHDNSWADAYRAYFDYEDPIEIAAATVRGLCSSGDRVGLPERSSYLSARDERRLKDLASELEWVDSTDIVARLRWVKSPREIEVIRRAGALTSRAMRTAIDSVVEDCSENDVIATFLSEAIRGGSEDPAMGPFIGAGVRSAFGHSSWEGRPLRRGDTVFFEASACVRRYSAPLMRTITIGEPSTLVRELEETSLAGADAGIAATRSGATAADIDAACRGAVRALGKDKYFRHRTGYSVGIGFTKWLDGFSLRPHGDVVLQENMVLHIIPFLSTGDEAVALSETVLVTAEGAERLVDLERKIFVR